jgi:hypothetical protein
MKTFALVENNLVTNVSIGNDDWQKENWIDCKNQSVGIGFTYDATRDAFIAPKPFNSWVLDEATCQWQAPTPMPTDTDKRYYWSEDDLSWREINV